jgi:hypothetical protein
MSRRSGLSTKKFKELEVSNPQDLIAMVIE